MSASGIAGIVIGSIAALTAILGGLWLSRKLRSFSVYNVHQNEEEDQPLTEIGTGGDSGGPTHPEVLPGVPMPAIEMADRFDENPFTFSKLIRIFETKISKYSLIITITLIYESL